MSTIQKTILWSFSPPAAVFSHSAMAMNGGTLKSIVLPSFRGFVLPFKFVTHPHPCARGQHVNHGVHEAAAVAITFALVVVVVVVVIVVIVVVVIVVVFAAVVSTAAAAAAASFASCS